MYRFETSFNASTSIGMEIVGNTLLIHHLPHDLCRRQMIIIIKDAMGCEAFRQVVLWNKNLTIDLKGLSSGTYTLNFLFRYGELFWAFFSPHSPGLAKNNGKCWFTSSPFAVSNSMKMNSLPTSRNFLHQQLQPDKRYQINDDAIRRCADMITRAHLFPYTRMLAVHDFVASEIAYDSDALATNRIQRQSSNALTTLQSGKGVCQGYTDLSIALLRSMDIPAMQIVCYALGAGTDGGWERPQNKDANKANHVLTAAFINHRWCFMDITWDSDWEFKGGIKREKTGCGLSHSFFDMTPTMLSFTHRLI